MTAQPFRLSIAGLQPLGRALMLPIAVLPAAGLMLRLGQADLLNISFMAAAGDAIFHNLGLLFAIGVAIGFARDGNGAAGLAGVVCFLVATNGAKALIGVPPEALVGLAGKARDLAVADFKSTSLFKLGVPIGILSGLIAGDFYNRFGALKLPEYLAFFGGRRFVPIVSGAGGLVLALVFGLGWTTLSQGVDALSRAIVGAGPYGLFVYGLLNRLLIVTGLHHVLNNVVWFIVGDYHGATGDLNRFFAGDPSAGAFMAGFFPVMMFGLPAACLAMFTTARPERRTAVGGMLVSLALTSFLTGVTEPIEFTFIFLAPVLYAVHAVLTGAAMVVMDALHVKLGFGFSAGLFDYLLNFNKATRPLLLLPVGLVYFAVYFGLFRFFILRLDLKTPGREDDAAEDAGPVVGDEARAGAFIAALGGGANLISVDACTTRLRLVVADQATVDDAGLKRLGARGVVRPSARDLQVVLGPLADMVAREINERLSRDQRGSSARGPSAPGPQPIAAQPRGSTDVAALLAALGGGRNVREVASSSSRLRIGVTSAGKVDNDALRALGVRGVVKPTDASVQIVVGPTAEALADDLRALLPAA